MLGLALGSLEAAGARQLPSLRSLLNGLSTSAAAQADAAAMQAEQPGEGGSVLMHRAVLLRGPVRIMVEADCPRHACRLGRRQQLPATPGGAAAGARGCRSDSNGSESGGWARRLGGAAPA